MESFPIPDVLECMRFTMKSPQKNHRIVRDYEFDLYIGGEREIYIDDVHYHLSEGSLVFRKPGETIIGYGDYDMYMLTLDFSHTSTHSRENYHRSSNTPTQQICSLDILDNIPSVFIPYRQTELKELYKKLSLCSYPSIVNRELQRSYIAEFLFLVLADSYKYNRLQLESLDRNSYVKKACNYINNHYSEQLTIENIAKYLSINKNYLIRLFKADLQITPHQYLLETRLLRSRYLLVYSDYSIQQVAFLCGFNTPSYFIKSFKAKFRKTPLAYRSSITNM